MGYGPVAITLHWLTAILVLAAYLLAPGSSELRVYAPERDFDRSLHEAIGLTVLTLTVLRLAWKARAPSPELPAIAPWMRRLSQLVQGLLYALLVLAPVTAIAGAWLEGHPLTLGVLGNVPPLLAKDAPLGRRIADLHTWLGDAVIWLAGLHAAAALFHHFVLRDEVLASMLPAPWRAALRRR